MRACKHSRRLVCIQSACIALHLLVFWSGVVSAAEDDPLAMQVTSIHSTLASSCSPDNWPAHCLVLATLDEKARRLLDQVRAGKLSEQEAKQQLQQARAQAQQSDTDEKQRALDELAAEASAREREHKPSEAPRLLWYDYSGMDRGELGFQQDRYPCLAVRDQAITDARTRTPMPVIRGSTGVSAGVSAMLYARAVGGFPFYDPLLLRIYRWGALLSLSGIVFAVIGVWRPSPLRWHAPACAIGTLLFWFAAAMGE